MVIIPAHFKKIKKIKKTQYTFQENHENHEKRFPCDWLLKTSNLKFRICWKWNWLSTWKMTVKAFDTTKKVIRNAKE